MTAVSNCAAILKDGQPFGMAGLYDNWINHEGKTVTTCTIVTTGANNFMKAIHHRMPVIIKPEHYDLWLNPAETDTVKLEDLLKPCDSELMKAYQVSLMVNSPANNSEDCILPI